MQTATETKAILYVGDETDSRNQMESALRGRGYRLEYARDGAEALGLLADSARIRLVMLDTPAPGPQAAELLQQIRLREPLLPIIIISSAASPLAVVEALKNGATDFLGKPIGQEELQQAVEKSLQAPNGAGHPPAEPIAPSAENHDVRFYCRNSRMRQIERALRQIGSSDVPVLLHGESGVGKEVVARQLHVQSPRARKPFLKINCAALPSELLESELFGYERGAFTGAFRSKPGKFEVADGGTILLDEIGDMDFKLQAKLLQVLQDHEFQRLGGKETIRVDVRVLAATHRDLEQSIAEGRFREDLYYRLNVIAVLVPPLRERRDEILPLAHLFLSKHASGDLPSPELTPALKDALLTHDWPGNIRELENVMRRFLVFRDADGLARDLMAKARRKPVAAAAVTELPPEERPLELREVAAASGPAQTPAPVEDPADYAPLPQAAAPEEELELPEPPPPEPPEEEFSSLLNKVGEARKQAEIRTILAALNSTHWNRKRAAERLHLDYKALLYKMKKLGLEQLPVSVTARSGDMPAVGSPTQHPDASALDQVVETSVKAESEAILAAVQATRWNRKKAAALLGVDYKALLYRMKKLGIGEGPNGVAP